MGFKKRKKKHAIGDFQLDFRSTECLITHQCNDLGNKMMESKILVVGKLGTVRLIALNCNLLLRVLNFGLGRFVSLRFSKVSTFSYQIANKYRHIKFYTRDPFFKNL